MLPLVCHVIESFGGGSVGQIRWLTQRITGYRHLVIHGVRPDEPPVGQIRQGFGDKTEFVTWPEARRAVIPAHDTAALRALITHLRKARPDVVHLHSSKAGFLGRLAASFCGLGSRVLYTPHGAAFLRQDIGRGGRALYGGIEWLASRLPGQVVAVSPAEQRAFARHGISSSYIPNGIVLGPRPDARPPRPADAPLHLITVSRLVVQKDPMALATLLIKATKALGPGRLRCTWVGDGPLATPWLAALEEAGVPAQVTGWLPATEVRGLLMEADVYISTARWEGQPLSVLEGMATGLPLLLSHIGGHLDLAVSGRNGATFHTATEAIGHLIRYLDEPALVEAHGLESRRIAEQSHDIADVCARYAALYDALARAPRPTSPRAIHG